MRVRQIEPTRVWIMQGRVFKPKANSYVILYKNCCFCVLLSEVQKRLLDQINNNDHFAESIQSFDCKYTVKETHPSVIIRRKLYIPLVSISVN